MCKHEDQLKGDTTAFRSSELFFRTLYLDKTNVASFILLGNWNNVCEFRTVARKLAEILRKYLELCQMNMFLYTEYSLSW